MFSYVGIIWYVAPESLINVSLSYFWLEYYVIKSSSQIISSVTLSTDSVGLFLLVTIFFFVVVHFAIISFLVVISFVLVGPWFFLLDSLVTVFLGMSDLVAVVEFWCIFSTFSMPEVLLFVIALPVSCTGTLVLGSYVKDFFIFS